MTRLAALIGIGVLLWSCAGSAPGGNGSDARPTAANRGKALEHFRAGALHDFVNRYDAALLEYHRALRYDSTNARILTAIGRDFFRTEQYPDAIRYLRRAHRYAPQDRTVLHYLAESHLKLNRIREAIPFYEALHRLDPYDTSVHANLIYLFTRTGQTEKLVDLREGLVELSGYQSEYAYQLLTLYLQLDRRRPARDLIRKLLVKQPQEPRSWIIYGNILELEKDPEGAITAYRRALALDADAEKTLRQIYSIYAERENWEGLVATFDTLMTERPGDNRVALYLAEGYFRTDRLERAETLLLPLLDTADAGGEAAQWMGRIAARRGESAMARAYFRRFAEAEPWNARAWEFLAALHFRDGDFEGSRRALEKGLESNPANPDLLSLYGTTLQQLGRPAQALEPLQTAYRHNPRELGTIVTLGLVLDALGHYAALDSLFQEAIRYHPDNALLLNNYSYSLGERGVDLDLALDLARRAVRQDPENGSFLDTIGWIHFRLGNLDDARHYLEKAVALRPGSAEIHGHLGDLYERLGRLGDARHHWQRALELDPDLERLRVKLEATAPAGR